MYKLGFWTILFDIFLESPQWVWRGKRIQPLTPNLEIEYSKIRLDVYKENFHKNTI